MKTSVIIKEKTAVSVNMNPISQKKIQEEASKVKTVSENLEQQIKELQQTIQVQEKKLLEINSEKSKVKQLVSDTRDLETKQKGEKVLFETLPAKSKRKVKIRDEQIKKLQKVIKILM